MSPDMAQSDGRGCGGDAAPFVLGALTPAEEQAFAAHLHSCAVCREEVAALQRVAATLPASAPPVSAPAGLKRRVMREVAADTHRVRSGRRSRTDDRRRTTPTGRRPVLAGIA